MSEEEKERRKQGISRRKFLTYTLGGTGGFLASVMLYPWFALPSTRDGAGRRWTRRRSCRRFNETYKSVQSSASRTRLVHPKGTKPPLGAEKPDGKSSPSPVCKHLGCTVTWEAIPSSRTSFLSVPLAVRRKR